MAGKSSLATGGGDEGEGMSPAQGPADPQQQLSSAVQVVRQAEESIVALSQQFPQVSDEVRKVRESLRSLLQKIVSNPGGQEPPAPRTML
jgi:phage shock protein A